MPVKGQSLAARRRLESKAQSLKSKECWGYLLECKHSLDDLKGCPMCKLAASATKEYYRIEQLKKLEKIAAGNLEKAQMRSTLLEMWSRSQLSSYGTMKTGTPSAEISFCAATLNALSWYCNNKEEGDSISWYFRDVRNDLELRKRMYEIGHYAALSIQCFVRSYLCRQRVKAFMMKRFEYTFPTRVRPGYYTDKKTKDFWPVRRLNKHFDVVSYHCIIDKFCILINTGIHVGGANANTRRWTHIPSNAATKAECNPKEKFRQGTEDERIISNRTCSSRKSNEPFLFATDNVKIELIYNTLMVRSGEINQKPLQAFANWQY